MRPAKRRARPSPRPRTEALPIRALYHVTHLARAAGVTYRTLFSLLKSEGARVYRAGRSVLVPLTEVEDKLPEVWESIKGAESLRGGLDDI